MPFFANHHSHVETSSAAGNTPQTLLRGRTSISSSSSSRSFSGVKQPSMMTPLSRSPLPPSPLSRQRQLQQASRPMARSSTATTTSSIGARSTTTTATAEGSIWTPPLSAFSSSPTQAGIPADSYENYSVHSSSSPSLLREEDLTPASSSLLSSGRSNTLKAQTFSPCCSPPASSSSSASSPLHNHRHHHLLLQQQQAALASSLQRSCSSPYSWAATPLSSSVMMDHQQDAKNDRTEMWLSDNMPCCEDEDSSVVIDGLPSATQPSVYPMPVPYAGASYDAGSSAGGANYDAGAAPPPSAYHSPTSYLVAGDPYDMGMHNPLPQDDMMSNSEYDMAAGQSYHHHHLVKVEDGLPRERYAVHYPEHHLDMHSGGHNAHPMMMGPAPPFDTRAGSVAGTASAAAEADEPYAQLIFKAFMSVPTHAMTIQELYQWFRDNTNKAKGQGQGWQNSIRHNLSMNDAFIKRERKVPPPPQTTTKQSSSGTSVTTTQEDDDVAVAIDAPAAAAAAGAGTTTRSKTSSNSTGRHNSRKNGGAAAQPKPPSEWVLAPFAIQQGYVISTTRYRKQAASKSKAAAAAAAAAAHHHQQHHYLPARAVSGRKGGLSSHRSRAKMMAQQQQQQQPRSAGGAEGYYMRGQPAGVYPQVRAAYAGGHYGSLDSSGAYGTAPEMEMLGLETAAHYGTYPPPAAASHQYHRLYDYISPTDAAPEYHQQQQQQQHYDGGVVVPPPGLMMARAPTVKSESLADEPLTPTDGGGSDLAAPFLTQSQSQQSCAEGASASGMLFSQGSAGSGGGFPYGLGDVVDVYEAGSSPEGNLPLFAGASSAEDVAQLLDGSSCQYPREWTQTTPGSEAGAGSVDGGSDGGFSFQ
ncbi:uncharacterized protein E0L32_003991 [Thyridium curvatum]|uniref:Fork-head domain-containing protein n=1 Tax=Thyridium curvatum TaxID=1093900 RepID=A0A507B236_9PEZI|nr:uncharacterized protein E0L32_003991 [Thyridium curvatum]TPX16342.1 hypothetical protein E0L32_003991 [Thyridium curvatum]